MIKLLIIIQSFKPYSGAINRLVDNLIKTNCFKSRIYTEILTLKYSIEDLEHDIIDGIHVFRIPNEIDYPAGSLIKKIYKIESIVGLIRKINKRFFFRKRKSFDSRISIRVCSFLKKHYGKYDVIMPITGKREIAYGCYLYSKTINNNSIVFYQVDPISTNMTFDDSERASNSLLEDKLYSTFAYTFTTSIIFDEVKKRHNKEYRIESIGFPSIVFTNQDNTVPQEDELFNTDKSIIKCVYIGSLYNTIRSPQYTIDLFSHLKTKDIYLLLYGNSPHIISQLYQKVSDCDQIIVRGKIPLEESIRIQNSADFLVNIGNVCTNMVPSKIFEYIGMGKPIINIYKSRNCPTIQTLKNYPCCINLFEEDSMLLDQVNSLREFIYNNKGKSVSRDVISYFYHDFLPETVAEVFYNKYISICNKHI